MTLYYNMFKFKTSFDRRLCFVILYSVNHKTFVIICAHADQLVKFYIPRGKKFVGEYFNYTSVCYVDLPSILKIYKTKQIINSL